MNWSDLVALLIPIACAFYGLCAYWALTAWRIRRRWRRDAARGRITVPPAHPRTRTTRALDSVGDDIERIWP